MKFSILYFIWWTVNISIKSYISVPEPVSVFMLAISAEPDEMLPYATFHQGQYCLPTYLLKDIQNKNYKIIYFCP